MASEASSAGDTHQRIGRANYELAQELADAHRREAATAEVLRAINRSTFNLQDVLDSLVKTAVQLTGAETGLILRQDGEVYRAAAIYDPDPERSEAARQSPAPKGRQSATGRAVLERRVVHIHDVLDDPEYTWAGRQTAGVRTILAVPMLREDIVVGVIACAHHEVRPFTAKQIQLVQTFADQAVIAIENTRLFEAEQASKRELQESLEYQTATSEVLNVISRSPTELQPVLDAIAATAARLCGSMDALVWRVVGGGIRVVAQFGSPTNASHPLTRGTVTGRAIVDRKTIHVHDLAAMVETEYPDAKEIQQRLGHRTVLATPLLSQGEALGAISVRKNRVQPFSDRQIALLQTFANQAVIAIENARLFEAVQTRTKELTQTLEQQTATSEVLGVISRSPGDLEPVFRTMLTNATQLCGADFGVLYRSEGDRFRVIATNGVPPSYDEERRRNPLVRAAPQTALGRAAATKKTVHLGDVQKILDYFDTPSGFTSPQLPRLAGARTILAVPMLKEDELIGIICIFRQEVKHFSAKQIELVSNFAKQAVIAIENTRLLSDLRESLQQQTATADVLKIISRATFDLPRVLETLVESAATLCDSYDTTILQREGDALRIVSRRGRIPAIGQGGTLPVRRGVTAGRAVLDRQTIHVADMQSETDEYPESSALARRLGFHTVLVVPLIRAGEAIGAIALRRSEVRPFTERQISLLRTFADQAVIAIENTRLFEEVQARTKELQESLDRQTATSEVLGVISRSPNEVKPVLDTIVATAQRLCQAERAAIWRLEGETFRPVAHHGMPEDLLESLYSVRMPVSRGNMAGRATLARRAVQVEDYTTDAELVGAARAFNRAGNIHTVLAVPLLLKGEPIGVIVLARTRVAPFDDKQVALVESFADQAVIAIENARLFEAEQASKRELTESLEQQTATADVLKVISRSALDVQKVLDALVESAARLCNAYDAAILQVFGDGLRLVAHHGQIPTSGPVGQVTFPLVRGRIGGRAVIERRTIQVADVLTEADEYPENLKNALQLGYRTVLAVPLVHAGGAIGVIVIRRDEVRPFTERQIELVNTFADQAVIAIENTRMFEAEQAIKRELQESLEYQTATSEVLSVISRSPNELQPVLDAIVATAGRLCEADYAHFRLEREGLYHVVARHALNPTEIKNVPGLPVAADRTSVSGKVASEGRTIHVPDVLADPEDTYAFNAGVPARTMLGVPLLRHGIVIGIIVLFRKAVAPFTERQIELVTTFADQAVIAIENTRLFEAEQAS